MVKICIATFLLTLSITTKAQLLTQTSNGRVYQTLKNDPYQTRFYTLSNGLTVVLSKNTLKPRFFAAVAVRAGSKNDPATHTGLAHYLEHLLFKGTDQMGTQDFEKEQYYLQLIEKAFEDYGQLTDEKKRKAKYAEIDSLSLLASQFSIANEYDRLMTYLGAQGTNAFTSFDETVYINNLPSNALELWIQVEAERFRNPQLRLFHTELEAVYEEKNISLDSDDEKVYEALFSNLFPNHPYGTQTTIGTIEHLKNPSIRKIKEFYYNYYQPNNMAVVLVGDFDLDATIEHIAKYFGYMQPGSLPSANFEILPPLSAPKTIEVSGTEPSSVLMAYRMRKIKPEEVPVAIMVDRLLGNDKIGLIENNLKLSQKVSDAYSYFYRLNDYTLFMLFATPAARQSLQKTSAMLMAQVDSLRKGLFSEAKLNAIAENEKINFEKSRLEIARACLDWVDVFIKQDPWDARINGIQALFTVNKKDIVDFVNMHLTHPVIVHKKQVGKVNNPKVEKPQISQVLLNREKQSDFYHQIISQPRKTPEPEFIDFDNVIEKRELSGGSQYFFVRNEYTDLFDLYFIFDLGSVQEPKLPLIQELFNNIGSTSANRKMLNEKLYALACDVSMMVGEYRTIFHLSGPAKNLEKALIIFRDIVHKPRLEQNLFKPFIANKIKNLNDRKKISFEILLALRRYMMYGEDSPVLKQLKPADLQRLAASDLESKLSSLFTYTHTLALHAPAKGVDAESNDLSAIVFADYSNYITTARLEEKKPIAFKNYTQAHIFLYNFSNVKSDIFWFKADKPFDQKLSAPARLFNEYFSGGMSSVVFQEIRESKALAYSTYSYYTEAPFKNWSNSIVAYIGTQADKTPDAIESMNRLLNKLPKSETGFSNAVSTIQSNIENRRLRGEALIFAYLDNLNKGITKDREEGIYEYAKQATWNDIEQFHKAHYTEGFFQIAIVGPQRKMQMKKLANQYQIRTFKAKDIFGY